MADHIALVGDSIFDNRSYTRGEPDVVHHLRDLVPRPWRATLVAVDGAASADIAPQLGRLPADVSHVVLAVGGNDVLRHMDLLSTPVRSTYEALLLFADRVDGFERDYGRALERVRTLDRPTVVCTVYNGNLDASQVVAARTALALFNDAIVRLATGAGVRVIDLRLVCTEAADYANAIEPSGRGGRKIATAIARAVGALPPPARSATVTAL